MSLSSDERVFFANERPFGLILFARNFSSPAQVRELVAQFRCAVGWHAPVFVDQEGGRVQRLGPPLWADYPAAGTVAQVWQHSQGDGVKAVSLFAEALGLELAGMGLSANCIPCLDVPVAGANDIIGLRAFGGDAQMVAQLGAAVIDGCRKAHIYPVIKHMPGHGRAMVDSHKQLPRLACSLDEMRASDFVPFQALNDSPFGMTAHVVVEALDDARPATQSPVVVSQIIRGEIGFSGLLMSDDLSMMALDGDIRTRIRGVFAAGVDMALHCNGEFSDMQAAVLEVPELADNALVRAKASLEFVKAPLAQEEAQARLPQRRAALNDLLGRYGLQQVRLPDVRQGMIV
ncbi:beta-N-acetylhexosaminidase [Polycladidibacter hongkongensis]|uniref:beta-N-acetylhexosaminidase n=1 Tax=Polycladidibacter hongkongensis TaxID=1647556 RepID=UPI00155E46AA|nr:beta-N-acetylhexosaminidase [Pseudovibrio hongkongensis]